MSKADLRKSKSPAPPRRRGRPSGSAKPVDGRERLLDTAVRLFSANGIAATPLSAIAKGAHVTPALLHYYFGDRDRLVDALVAERIEPLVLQVGAQLAAGDAQPSRMIEAFVCEVIAMLAANEWLAQLWLREVLSEGGLLRERVLSRVAPIVSTRVHDAAVKAQRKGQLNRDLDPRLLMVSLIGLAVFPFASAPIWRRLYSANDVTPEILTRHVLALLSRGLELHDA
ncbi:MAG: TetR/AcrR family transcriptional regulator [Tahibacter sp.]